MWAILRRRRLFRRKHVKSPSCPINRSAKQTKAAASSRGLCLYCPEFADEVDNASMQSLLATMAIGGCDGWCSRWACPLRVLLVFLSAVAVFIKMERGENGAA